MNQLIEKFSAVFAREGFLTASVTATLILYAVNLVGKILCGLYSLFVVDSIFVLCVAALFIAYRNHNKNVQKGLLGAVLMWYLYDEINYAVGSIILNSDAFAAYNNFWGCGYLVMSLITVALFAALFVNHFIINGDHHSRSFNVFLNQLLVIVIAVLSLVSMVFQCFLFDGDFANTLEAISWHTGLTALVLMIAAYESRFNAYKLKREAEGEM